MDKGKIVRKDNKDRIIPTSSFGPYTINYQTSIELTLNELREGKINEILYQKIKNTKRRNLVNLFSEINLRSIDEKREEDYSQVAIVNLSRFQSAINFLRMRLNL